MSLKSSVRRETADQFRVDHGGHILCILEVITFDLGQRLSIWIVMKKTYHGVTLDEQGAIAPPGQLRNKSAGHASSMLIFRLSFSSGSVR